VFTGFVAWEALTTIALFLVSQYETKHTYFLSYWITGFADYIVQLAVIYEVARDVLRPTGTWVLDARTTW
jgi:hypothetical protein